MLIVIAVSTLVNIALVGTIAYRLWKNTTKQVQAEAVKMSSAKLPPFTAAERDAWEKYQFKINEARQVYDLDVARLHQIHDQGLEERARERFLKRRIAGKNLSKQVTNAR